MNNPTTPATAKKPRVRTPVIFVSLDAELRASVETASAARHLMRTTQCLRRWASRQDGPLQPIKIGGRLAWSIADIKRVLAGGA
ncbi:MAG: hypothetical protein ACOH2M_29720 [Cypionkella sp.]